MDIKKKIAQRHCNRASRYVYIYNSFFTKFSRSRRVYLFVNEKCVEADLKKEARQQSLISTATAFEVFCRDFFEKKMLLVSEEIGVARLGKIEDKYLKKEITTYIKNSKANGLSAKDYISAKFNFQRFDDVLQMFSALVQSDFSEAIGVSGALLKNINGAWELRHRLVHDVNLKMDISDERLSKYIDSMRQFSQLASWKGLPIL